MSQNRSTQAQLYEYEGITAPFAGSRYQEGSPSNAQLAQGMDRLVQEVNERLRELYSKIYGRIALRDLNGATQTLISNKMEAQDISTWLVQNSQEIAALVNTEGFVLNEDYVKDKVYRGLNPPENPENQTLWLDTGVSPAVLKSYDGTNRIWTAAISGMTPDNYYQKQTIDSQLSLLSGQIALKVSTATYDSDKVYRGAEAPLSPQDGLLWLDTSQEPNLLCRWDQTNQRWQAAGARMVKTENGITIDTDGINVNGDIVNIRTRLMTLEIEDEDEDGVIKVTINKDGIDTPKITSQEIRTDDLSIRGQQLTQSQRQIYYWAPGGTGDGLTSSHPCGDLQALVNKIPNILYDDAVLRMASNSVWDGDLEIRRKWGARLEIQGYNTRINGCLSLYHCADVSISNLSASRCVLRNTDLTWSGGKIQCSSATDAAISMERCRVYLYNVEVNDTADMYGILVDKGSVVSLKNCKGDCIQYLRAQNGSMVFQHKTIPYGSSSTPSGLSHAYSGSDVTATHGSGYVAPANPPVQTYTFDATSTRSIRGSTWGSNGDLFQGEYCYIGHVGGIWGTQYTGKYHGCLWFPMPEVPNGYSVTRLRLYLRRINGGGINSAQPVRLWKITSPAQDDETAFSRGQVISNGLTDSYGPYLGLLSRDEEKWFELPVSLAGHLQTGGICLYSNRASSTNLYEYIQCYGADSAYPPKLEITMTQN